MDHLHWHADATRPRPTVPYLCHGLEHDICEDLELLKTWPDQHGLDLTSSKSYLESARIAQAWLYFGVLQAISRKLNIPWCTADCVVEREGRHIVLSTKVHYFLRRATKKMFVTAWVGRLSSAGEAVYHHLQLTMQVAGPWITRVVREDERQSISWDPWIREEYAVFLSGLLLFESICALSVGRVDRSLRSLIDSTNNSIAQLHKNSKGIPEGLRLVGRCPSVLKRANITLPQAFHLLSVPASSRMSHVDCTYQSCSAFNIDVRTYKAQHTSACQAENCFFIGFDSQTLSDLALNDDIPVVCSRQDLTGSVRIDVVSSTTATDFVAVSHVWAGGLGNFQKNALYKCQLERLHKTLQQKNLCNFKAQSRTVYYWLDTLCIPAQEGPAKSMAINAMARIYAGAESVLVIDPELLHTSIAGLNRHEIDLLLLCSPWMARSWTLQEGALGMKVNVQFADKVLLFEDLDPDIKLSRSTPIQSVWKRDVDRVGSEGLLASTAKLFDDILSHLTQEEGRWMPALREEKFLEVWNELCYRSSTKSEDLPIILAGLLDHSAGEVLNLGSAQRMHALLRAQGVLPASLLFAPCDSRMASWCPKMPNCTDSFYLLNDRFGSMHFKENDTLVLPQIKHLTILQCTFEISLGEHILLHDSAANHCLQVHFESTPAKTVERNIANVLFLLNPWHLDKQGFADGMVFTTVRDDQSGVSVKYIKRCKWICLTNACNTSTIGHDLSRCRCFEWYLRRRDSSTNLHVPHHYAVTSPLGAGDISDEHPLVLDMGLESWPSLSWSRSTYFPFIESSLQIAKPLNMFQGLVFFSSVYTAAVLLLRSVMAGFHFSLPGLAALLALTGIFCAISRLTLGGFERRVFRNILNKYLQQKWANSFATTRDSAAGSSKNFVSTPVLTTIILFYGTLTVSTSICFVVLVIRDLGRYRRYTDMPVVLMPWVLLFDADPVTVPFLLPTVAKQICKATFFELLARAIMLFAFGWKRQLAPRSNFQSSGPETDGRFDWLILGLKVVFLPLLLAVIALCITFIINTSDTLWHLIAGFVLLMSLAFVYMGFVVLYRSELNTSLAWLQRSTGSVLASLNLTARRMWYGHPDREVQL